MFHYQHLYVPIICFLFDHCLSSLLILCQYSILFSFLCTCRVLTHILCTHNYCIIFMRSLLQCHSIQACFPILKILFSIINFLAFFVYFFFLLILLFLYFTHSALLRISKLQQKIFYFKCILLKAFTYLEVKRRKKTG